MIQNGYRYYIDNVCQIFTSRHFRGWGRKKTGRFAYWLYKLFGGSVTFYEDGFIRSIGLGVENAPSFSIVKDNVGIYYDATMPSKLEIVLNTYDFKSDAALMNNAKKAIELIKEHHISKYNDAPLADKVFCRKYGMSYEEERVLIIAQTAEDASLQYGLAEPFETDEMIRSAIEENPDASIYLKIHPDVLSGRKKSDIDMAYARKNCIIIEEHVNPISLLKYFSKVYTKTSLMGFEALLMGCECVCFGMPFYAGWGVTKDKISNEKRKRSLRVEEIFAAAYIYYTSYYNPYKNKESDIFDTIWEIVRRRDLKKMEVKRS